MRPPHAALVLSLALVAWLSPRVAGAADADTLALEHRYVRRIQIDARPIFDPIPRRGRTLYRLANRVHIVTRASTLRSALVFHEGDLYTEAKRAETERHLRGLPFVVPDRVVATPVGAESVDVRVVTHDNWTTSPEFSIESGGGQRFGAVSLVERNLVGLGTSLSLSYRSDVNGISRMARIEDGEMFGTHWRGRVSVGNNSGGRSSGVLLSLPFWSEEARFSATGGWSRDTYDASLYANGELASTIPIRSESSDLVFGVGRKRGDGTIVRMLGVFEQRDRTFGTPRLEPNVSGVFARGAERLDIRRVAAEVQVSRSRYIVVHAVEQMDRAEDVDLGPGMSLKAGFAPTAFGSSANEANLRIRMHAARDRGRAGYGTFAIGSEARLRPRICEMVSDLNARWVNQPARDVAFVTGLMGIHGYAMEPDFQVALGGITGLRGFPVHELTGTQGWRGNAELRWVALHDCLELASLGAAAFWDAGRTWGAGSTHHSWRNDAGFGLRVSLPHSALNAVARFDVAWPVGPAHRHGPAYSFGSGQAF